ncbi:MAG: Hpt domain-containing protein [Hyphomicrobiaceae bacterium]
MADPPEPVLDVEFLNRQTFGDRAFRRELLDLFVGNAASLSGALEAEGDDTGSGAVERYRIAAHSLKGAARGVGARRLGLAAEAAERAAAEGGEIRRRATRLVLARIAEVRSAIGEIG